MEEANSDKPNELGARKSTVTGQKNLFAMRNIICAVLTATLLLEGHAAFSKPVINTYDLKFSFDFREQKLFCKAELSVDKVAQNDTLNLLLYRLLKVRSIRDDLGNAVKFAQGVTSFSDWEALQVNYISVFIGQIRPSKTKQTIIIEYEGLLLGYVETGMLYVKDNIDPGFTILRADCYAYPIQGIPCWEKNRAGGLSYFDYSISVTVPDTLPVANGGQLMSRNRNNGSIEFVYKNLKPAWRIDIAIVKYSTFSDNGIAIHFFNEDSAGAKIVETSVKKALELYASWFGKIPVSNYSIIEIPYGCGSQTDVTCIIQTASAFKNIGNLYELYHEISHLWNISANYGFPCRLESEGLAMFVQYLTMEKLNNKPGILDSAAASIFMKLKKKFSADPLAANSAMIDYGKMKMTDLSYSKGMLFFYLLYKTVGESVFLKTINGYYSAYRSSGATTAEFSKYLMKESNSKKVETLINQWILTNKSSQNIVNSKSLENLLD